MGNPTLNKTLFLILCGDTPWDRESRLRGRTDLPLANAGRAMVVSETARLEQMGIGDLKVIYHPDDEAARDTAGIFAGALKVKTKVAFALADPDLGLLEGLTQDEFEERYPRRHKQWLDDPLALIPPEGESLTDAKERVFRAVAKIVGKSRREKVAVVVHPVGYGFLRALFTRTPLPEEEENSEELYDGGRVEAYGIDEAMLRMLKAEVTVSAGKTAIPKTTGVV